MPLSARTLAELPWLPRPDAQFRKYLADVLGNPEGDWGMALRGLATAGLDTNQSLALARASNKLRDLAPSASLSSFRLGILSTATTDLLAPLIVAAGLRHGVSIETVAGDFGDLALQSLDPSSRINTCQPDAVLVASDHRGLPIRSADAGWPMAAPDRAIAVLDSVCGAVRANSGATCIVQNLPSAPYPLLGNSDALTPGTTRHAIAAVNRHLENSLPSRGDLLLDIDWLSGMVGLDNWYDERMWNMGRMPCSQQVMPLYADFVARTVAAMRGKSRKCLVLDLDNTLWGGIIGDDGMDGIKLSIGDARGEAHRMVQQFALDLAHRGVVLAICSKNDESTAREVFQKHPGMLLRETDIAAFVANWDDKATNMERIARQLNLGIDSLVLLDDNPVERAQVRLALPQVAVPEIGSEPAHFPAILAAAGYFETTSFTREDALRSREYQSTAAREQVLLASRSLDDFLASLDLTLEFGPFDAAGRARIAQLINKTNQFNLTTRRYTEREVTEMETSDDWFTLQVTAKDRFGDSGMISVMICRKLGQEWVIDSWLMSCRVFNRRIEHATMNHVVACAKAEGASRIRGEYIPTPRNKVVQNLYSELGYAPDADPGCWVLDAGAYVPFNVAARIVARGGSGSQPDA